MSFGCFFFDILFCYHFEFPSFNPRNCLKPITNVFLFFFLPSPSLLPYAFLFASICSMDQWQGFLWLLFSSLLPKGLSATFSRIFWFLSPSILPFCLAFWRQFQFSSFRTSPICGTLLENESFILGNFIDLRDAFQVTLQLIKYSFLSNFSMSPPD